MVVPAFFYSENMEDYFDGFSEDITKWEIVREMVDLDLDDEAPDDSHKSDPSVQLLPRQDVVLYGNIPKMEQRVYTKCKECCLVFHPRDILSHKTCSGKIRSSSPPQSLKKKVKSKTNTSKKTHSSLPPLFKKPPSPATAIVSSVTAAESKPSSAKVSSKVPKISTGSSTSSSHTLTTTTPTKSEPRVSSGSSHVSKSSSVHSPKSPSKSSSSSAHSPKSSSKTVTSTETVGTSSTSSSSSSSSSNRHKKSRKSSSSSKVTKEFDPDLHCGVVEGSRGPCTRSITCSNHRIQLRKLVPGRSKDIHQLIAERKAAKEKELKHSTSHSYLSPNGLEEKDTFDQNTSYVPIVATIVTTIDSTSTTTTTYVPILPKSNSSTSRQISTSILAAKQLNMTDMENIKTKTSDGDYLTNIHNNSQENAIGTVPVVYMPMSPISQSDLTEMEVKTKTLDGSYLTNINNNSQENSIGTVPVVYMPMSPISQLDLIEADNKKKTADVGYLTNIKNNPQENTIGTVPVVYMPLSPISVSPFQFVQIGKNMICLESPQSAMSPPLTSTQSVFLTIPKQQNTVKLYKSHPKPVATPVYGSKKVGGAIVLSNQQRVESQRNTILLAVNKDETVNNAQGYRAISLLNHTNTPHRPNILKVKSVNKVSSKRPAVDKVNTSDSKQLRLSPNVNGFILYSDISETAEAPQSNNSIQEKIALLNMK